MSLVLTTEESLVITALDAPMEEAFANGVTVPGGTPPTLPEFPGYRDLKTDDPRMGDQKALTKNAFRNPFAAFISALKSTLSYTTATNYGTGWGPWGDPAYSNGVVRYYKNIFGEVRVTGLARAPMSPGADETMLTLPAGYRPGPNDAQIFAGAHNSAFACIQVFNNGDIVFNGTPTADGWVSLNFSFKAGA